MEASELRTGRAAVCSGNKQSGGKQLSGHITKGNAYLRAILCEVA
jgi:transposase